MTGASADPREIHAGGDLRLYTSPNSPFSTRVRIAAHLKGLSLESAPLPVGGLRSAEFLAINPVAKIPVLVTEEGDVIPESEAILRYLEDRFPTPALMPSSARERARVNVAIRITDAYLMDPVIRLFPHLNTATRDSKIVDAELARWAHGAALLSHWLSGGLPVAEAGLTLADCVLGPALHLSTRIAAMLDLTEDPARAHQLLIAYQARMMAHEVMGPVLAELTSVQHDYDIKAGRPSVARRHDIPIETTYPEMTT